MKSKTLSSIDIKKLSEHSIFTELSYMISQWHVVGALGYDTNENIEYIVTVVHCSSLASLLEILINYVW